MPARPVSRRGERPVEARKGRAVGASMRIGIAGAGTAGLCAAMGLARAGHQVIVFERHEHMAPLGAGILMQPAGLRALQALGAGEPAREQSWAIERLDARSKSNASLVGIDFLPSALARSISRPRLTRLLQERALACGARIEWGASIEGLSQDASAAVARVSGRAHRFDAFIIASGGGSDLGLRAGLSSASSLYPWGAWNGMVGLAGWGAQRALSQRCDGASRMMGLMPTIGESGDLELSLFWSERARAGMSLDAQGFASMRQSMLDLWPEALAVIEGLADPGALSFATYRHAWPKRLALGRLALIGDAAHAMSPQLGLGSTLAAQDALALTECLVGRDPVAELTRFERQRRWPSKRAQALSRALTPCFQSTLPGWARDPVFSLSSRIPGVKSLMRACLDP